uniref:NADH dehydrogenase [ubiquinone] 1 beta subcomplex subunit 11, mitochondrial n=1 Tax=Corethrella appendiculata TaxID=1370023 RepID=U5EES5_9DIPT
MAALIRLNNNTNLRNLINLTSKNVRLISTSGKKSDTATIDVKKSSTETTTSNTPTFTAADLKKNWVSYGWDFKDKKTDRDAMKASFFFSVTLCMVIGGFFWAYLPDPNLRDWSQREAYLVLRRREAAGEEPVNPNYIDPAKLILPSDEELGDREIII